MTISLHGMVMVFGAFLAVAGLFLLVLRKEQGQNRIRLFGQQFQVSTPALVVFLAGCAIFILPFAIPSRNEPLFSFWQPKGPFSDKDGGTIITTEEKGPNDEIVAPNLIELGTTISGSIAPDQDRDFFKFKTSAGGMSKIRLILRKKALSSFGAAVAIYDSAESKVTGNVGFGEDPVSFAFDGAPNSTYYVLVESYNHSSHGSYELVVREE
jgi:hypothetical protein